MDPAGSTPANGYRQNLMSSLGFCEGFYGWALRGLGKPLNRNIKEVLIMINAEKRYCGLSSVRIEGLTEEQANIAMRYLQDYSFSDECRNEQCISLSFYCNHITIDGKTYWSITVYLNDSAYAAKTEIPWFAGKNITSMYLNFRERNKRFNQLIEDLLKAIDSE